MVRFCEQAPLITTSWAPIAEMLRRGQYVARLELTPHGGTRATHSVVFVCKVPWDPLAARRFAIARSVAEQAQAAFQNCRLDLHEAPVGGFLGNGVTAHRTADGPMLLARPEWCEKTCVALWGLPKLEEVVRANGVANNEYFRPAFVVVLSVALPFLRRGSAEGVMAETVVELPAWQQGAPRAIAPPP